MIHNGNADEPNVGLDGLLLVIFCFVLLGMLVSLVGTIPALIIIISFVISAKSGSIDHIRVAARFIQIILIFGCAVAFYAATQTFNPESEIIIAALCLGLVVILEFFWIGPVSRQLNNLRQLFTPSSKHGSDRSTRIMDRDGLAPFSVADELQKWSQLRADGIVTESEYQAARDRIINGGR